MPTFINKFRFHYSFHKSNWNRMHTNMFSLIRKEVLKNYGKIINSTNDINHISTKRYLDIAEKVLQSAH